MAVAKKPAAGKAAKKPVSSRPATAKGIPEAKKKAAAKPAAKASPKKAAPLAKKAAAKPAPAKGKATAKVSAKPAVKKAAPKVAAAKAKAPAKNIKPAPKKAAPKKVAAPAKKAVPQKAAAKPAAKKAVAKKATPAPAKVSKPAAKNTAKKVVMPKAKSVSKSKPQSKPSPKVAAKKPTPAPAKAATKSKAAPVTKKGATAPAKVASSTSKSTNLKAGPKPVKDSSNAKFLAKEVAPMETKTKASTIDSKSLKSAAPATPAASKPGRKLKPEELNKLRSMLHQERERIIEEMRILDDRSLTANPEDSESQQPGFSLQLADSATDNIQVETDLAIRNIEAEQLSQIDDALRSIDMGEYGICNRCHQAIDFERLKAKPNARYCVSCLRLLEAGKA